jgi:hypothetical protein
MLFRGLTKTQVDGNKFVYDRKDEHLWILWDRDGGRSETERKLQSHYTGLFANAGPSGGDAIRRDGVRRTTVAFKPVSERQARVERASKKSSVSALKACTASQIGRSDIESLHNGKLSTTATSNLPPTTSESFAPEQNLRHLVSQSSILSPLQNSLGRYIPCERALPTGKYIDDFNHHIDILTITSITLSTLEPLRPRRPIPWAKEAQHDHRAGMVYLVE